MKSKAQIAIEFLIVFAFILLVFLFLFSLITQQRAVIQNTQTYSQLQLIAQNLALQISRAAISGNGYSAQLPLLTSVGVTPYNVSITKSGTVIVTSTTAQQAVRTTAFSSVQKLTSNPAYLASGSTTVYNLPIANGSVSIQNSFGTICIDYQCPTTSNVSSSISLSSQVVHAALFSGVYDYINASSTTVNTLSQSSITISFWVDPEALGHGTGFRGSDQLVCIGDRVSSIQLGYQSDGKINVNGWQGPSSTSTNSLSLNRWYYIAYTQNAVSNSLYINGALESSLGGSAGTTMTRNVSIGGSNQNNGGKACQLSSNSLNGEMANVQLYNAALTPNQILSEYSAGISAAPPNTANVVGWWPLSGDANDYSGSGMRGTIHGPLLFTSVAQLSALVRSSSGQPESNVLVGFSTTLGNFTWGLGSKQFKANYTNSNGIATVFLNQQGNNGQALVRATTLNGNFLPQSSLVAWYPLNLGQGSVAGDVSGNSNSGNFASSQNSLPFWSLPNYVASFDGHTSYITVANSPTLNFNTQLTYSIWVKRSGPGQQNPRAIVLSRYGTYIDLCYNSQPLFSLALLSGSKLIQGGSCMQPGVWTNYIATYDGTNARLYLNGAQVANAISPSTILNSANALTIGEYDNSLFNLNGSIANVQVYTQALTQSQVSQLYQEGISGAPIANTAVGGWWPLDGDAIDYGPNGNNGVIFGNLTFTPTAKAIPPQQISNGNTSKVLAASFGASNSYVSYYQGQNTVLSTASVFGWINTSANNEMILQIQNGSSSNPLIALGIGGALSPAGNANQLVAYVRNSLGGTGGGTMPFNSNIVVNNNAWHQVGLTLSGTQATLYVDGIQGPQTTFYGSFNLANTPANQIIRLAGIAPGSGASQYNGLISDVQVYSTNLTRSQAQQLYQEGIEGPPVPSANVFAWWPLSGNSNDYGLNGINSTLASNVVYKNVRNYAPILAQNSNYSGVNFNGQGSYINFNGIPTLSSSAITVDAWVNEPASHQGEIVRASNSVSSSIGTSLRDQGNGMYQWHVASATNSIDLIAPIPSFSSWHFVAGTYDGTTSKIYVDGAASNSMTTGLQLLPTNNLGIGAWSFSSPPSNFFNGSIVDVQIYSTALSATQIQQLYSSQIPPSASTTVPLSWYP
ncbi:MAG: LamG domain-containing protein [Candidatus Micrarchaeota archaeon]|nr:LamG domain-containing protein [Candidatus Micrarchaeota archaeon]